MSGIQRLDVYLYLAGSKQKVGTLARKERKIYFEYDKAFLETGVQISPYKLPLKSGVMRCDDDTFDGIWGVFADSLPDGWGKLLVDRHMKKRGIDPATLTPLDRLAYVGDYAMGALSYEPSVRLEGTVPEEIILDDLALYARNILEGESEDLVDTLLNLSGSSAGARPKVLVQLSEDRGQIIHGREKLAEGYSHWIVKFASSSDSSEMGAIEYAYSLMAKAAGLDMPPTVLLEGKKGRYFACERFDRRGEERVHMHSVAALVHSDFRYPILDYDDLLTLTLHLTKNMQDVEKVFRLTCFNLFSHNRDDHAKNFSFLMDADGQWHFSPVYDITFSSGPGGEHSTMYLGEGKYPTKDHLEALGKKHQIKYAGRIIGEVEDAVANWHRYAKESGMSQKVHMEIGKVLRGLS